MYDPLNLTDAHKVKENWDSTKKPHILENKNEILNQEMRIRYEDKGVFTDTH